MKTPHLTKQVPNSAKVEISTGVLSSLIASGLLKVSECKCLDENAKQVLWQSLLTSSVSEGASHAC